MIYGEITYQPIDDQRSKCSLCQRVIYKLLQKAHTTSHSAAIKSTLQEDKTSGKAIKKFSLHFENPLIEPAKKLTGEKSSPAVNFEQMLKSNKKIDLPQKNKSDSLPETFEKKAKFSYSYCIKQSKQCENSLLRLNSVYERCVYMKILKVYRRWKKV